MNRNSVYYLILLGAFALAGEKILSLGRQNTDLQSQNQDLQGQIANLKSQILKEHMKDQTEIFAAQTAVEELQNAVKSQKDTVASAEQRLNSEKNGGGGKQLPNLRNKVEQQKQVIADLEARVREMHSQADGLRNQDKYYQQQAGVIQKQTDDQLKQQIAEQEQTLKEMQQQAQADRQNAVVNPDYAQKYQEMRANIEVQKNTIQQLKDQRSASSAQWGYQKSTSHSQNEQDVGSLRSNEHDLLEQLKRERATLATLNQDIQSGVQTQKSQTLLVQNAQTNYDNQKARLQDLESQLAQAQEHLAQLVPVGATASPTPGQE